MTQVSSTPSEPSADETRKQPASRVRSAHLARLTHKELRETLRDRRTIFTLVLMPILIYPLLTIVFQQFLFVGAKPSADQKWLIGITHEEHGPLIEHLLHQGDQALGQPAAARTAPGMALPSFSPQATAEPQLDTINLFIEPNLLAAVRDNKLDLGILITPRENGDVNETELSSKTDSQFQGVSLPAFNVQLIQLSSSEYSRKLARFVERRLQAFNERSAEERLRFLGDSGLLPTHVTVTEVASTEEASFSIATLVPLILILMTITGAVYPAIDLTAGERERGTLEALMAAPVPRLRVLMAKYVAVLVVAVLTAIVNVLAMTVTLYSTGLGKLLLGKAGFTAAAVGQVFLLLLLFAMFFAAMLLALTSFARSFKEAQAYLIPVVLLSLGPGFLTLMPGLRFNFALAVLPLVNIVLLARDIFQGGADPWLAGVAIITSMLYALAALALAAKIFGGDAILYGSQGSWSDLWRRPSSSSARASATVAAITTAALFPLYFLVGGVLGQFADLTIGARQAIMAGATAILFMGLPWGVLLWQRVRVTSGFQLSLSHPLYYVGAMLLGVSLWPFAYELFLVGRQFSLIQLDKALLKRVMPLVNEWRQLSPFVILLTTALAPAVCEELFFRGFLIGAMRRRAPSWLAIVTSGVLFGLFHTFVGSQLTVERFLPTTFLGLVLATICWHTCSVVPGIVLHLCHNGLVVMMVYYRDELTTQMFGHGEAEHLPWQWLIVAGFVALLGTSSIVLAVLQRNTKPTDAPEKPLLKVEDQ